MSRASGRPAFADRIAEWQRREGRTSLPWQVDRDPYRIWVSEVMLQQTQVSTVIPYYERFLRRFPDVAALAEASVDDVLRHWSGLGYYARGRNLHRAAGEVMTRFGGHFPGSVDELASLPGIGRSTAAAIAVFAYGTRAAILDGNVKRVLARAFGVEGWPGAPRVQERLWRLAEDLLPHDAVEAYTQGLMDLGSLVCVRGTPACLRCPVHDDCVARLTNATDRYPAARPKAVLPHRSAQFLILERDGQLLLERRPSKGVWGGLWCLPQVDTDADPARTATERYGLDVVGVEALHPVEHSFTHYRLTLVPWRLTVRVRADSMTSASMAWIDVTRAPEEGIPAPIRTLLLRLNAASGTGLPFTPA